MSKPTLKRRSTELSRDKKKTNRKNPAQASTDKIVKHKRESGAPVGQVHSLAQQTRGTESKQTRIIAMLRTPSGATIDALMRATGWQPHSVRGFLAGVIRKKLGLNLESTSADNGRVYRITSLA
jgi:hypothetical protein